MRDGFYAASQAGLHNIIIEGNNEIVIQALQGTTTSSWNIQSIIRDILIQKEVRIHIIAKQVFRGKYGGRLTIQIWTFN